MQTNFRNGGKHMKEIILSIVAGIAVGILFRFLKLPIPAPPVLSGVLGIFGVYIGGLMAGWIMDHFT
jgi:XapX domain-containing protein